jgi:Holliday junction resolvasome RuvABC endonuclease subunit
MAIDPSGRGKDETGYAVVKVLNGFLFVTRAGGLPGGYDNATLQRLAMIAKEERVNQIIIEANFGDGMYTKLFEPVISKVHPCAVEEVKHHQQKERRIIDTLEPVMNRHKLIIDRQVIYDDWKSAQAYSGGDQVTKTLIHQLTRLNSERGCLKHDDRLDALAIAVAFHTENMAADAEAGIDHEKQLKLDKELERFMEHAVGNRRGRVDTGSAAFGHGKTGARIA